MLNIVIGTSGSGKSHFIKERFTNWEHFSVGEYQRRLREEASMSGIEMLLAANEQIKNDVAKSLKEGKAVVMEHTLYKAKRRIGYIEAFRKVTDEPINIYVMQPSDEQLLINLKASDRLDESDFESIKYEKEQIEMPNMAEGYDKIFTVTDGTITEYIAPEDSSIITKAKEELEAERLREEAYRKEAEAKEKELEQFIDKLEEDGFWHYCEGCGAKKKMNSKQAFEEGWDYPGKDGIYKVMPTYGFGIVAPRTCGNCGIEKTLRWRKLQADKSGGAERELSKEERKLIGRIIYEPYSLAEEEAE